MPLYSKHIMAYSVQMIVWSDHRDVLRMMRS